MAGRLKRQRWFAALVIALSLCVCACGGYVPDASGVAGGSGFSISDVPEYSGSASIDIDGGQPGFSEEDKRVTRPFERYSEMDALGRCGAAYANVCRELMPTEEREGIGMIRPSGWQTANYGSLVDGNYLYNRCHLIAFQLAGENANERNLITGTRYMNVEGMLPYEEMTGDYVRDTGNHVLYRVTPIFDGADLVASGVEMEAWSVEDAGEGICFHVYCYNVQPGITIDYSDGSSREALPGENTSLPGSSGGNREIARRYILNTSSKRIHLPECSGVESMSEKNKKEYTGTLRELEEAGYSPCGICLGG